MSTARRVTGRQTLLARATGVAGVCSSAMTQASLALAGARRAGNHPVLRFVVRRVVAAAITLILVSMLIFVGTEILPGDAAQAILGRSSTPAAVAELRHELGLNRPA